MDVCAHAIMLTGIDKSLSRETVEDRTRKLFASVFKNQGDESQVNSICSISVPSNFTKCIHYHKKLNLYKYAKTENENQYQE